MLLAIDLLMKVDSLVYLLHLESLLVVFAALLCLALGRGGGSGIDVHLISHDRSFLRRVCE